MKKIISLVTVAFGFNVFATSPMPWNPGQGVNPTRYTCQAGDTEVVYTTTSFIGKPQMHVTFQGETAESNAEVKSEMTAIGRLVSINDMHLVPIDGPTIRYSLVIPKVTLKDNATPAQFDSVLIRTTVGNFLFGPHKAANMNSEAVNVSCTADVVWF